MPMTERVRYERSSVTPFMNQFKAAPREIVKAHSTGPYPEGPWSPSHAKNVSPWLCTSLQFPNWCRLLFLFYFQIVPWRKWGGTRFPLRRQGWAGLIPVGHPGGGPALLSPCWLLSSTLCPLPAPSLPQTWPCMEPTLQCKFISARTCSRNT